MKERGYWRARDRANGHRERGEYSRAGHWYTLAAHEALGASEYVVEPYQLYSLDIAYALWSFEMAVYCYRLVGERHDLRARQGVLLAEELRDQIVESDAERGLLAEVIGDFRLLGALGEHDEAYAAAATAYAEVDEPHGTIRWQAEPLFELVFNAFLDICDDAGHSIDRRVKATITAESLNERIEYKREHFPVVLDAALALGEREVDRE